MLLLIVVNVCFVVRVKVLHIGEFLTTNLPVRSCLKKLEELSCFFGMRKQPYTKCLTMTDVSISSAGLHTLIIKEMN